MMKTNGFWDEIYDTDQMVFGEVPNEFLASQEALFLAGARVLVPGDGEGRNGVWLAALGCAVTTIDGSAVAVAKAKVLAKRRGVNLAQEVADIGEWPWPRGEFDAVAILFVHLPPAEHRDFHARAAGALRPGGRLVIEAYHPRQIGYGTGGPKDVALTVTASDLKSDLASLRPLELEEREVVLAEGCRHQGPSFVTRGVFERPPVTENS